ncbi:hypothetical protein [Spirillospora sp. NPDC047279]|uniref:hypothetical protein n=1 Tax=Spirillospora sp. NPDC047279 TaxID=3155478 RepID=UPI0033FAD950
MRIPKRVNTALDWAEKHFGALAVVVTLLVASAAALLAPLAIGLPVAGFILGLTAGGFVVHTRGIKRIARVRAEVDDLLRENGKLRHRNTVLKSGVISRESMVTQAIVPIPEDVPEDDPQRTTVLPSLPDEPAAETGTTAELDDGAEPEPAAVPEPAAETGTTAELDDDLTGATDPGTDADAAADPVDGATKPNKSLTTGGTKTVGNKPGGGRPGGAKPGGAAKRGKPSGSAASKRARSTGN